MTRRINEIYRLLGRYEEKLALLRVIIGSHNLSALDELDMQLIRKVLDISEPPFHWPSEDPEDPEEL